MNITPEALAVTLPIMAKGMLGIFAVTAVIICIVAVLNAATSKKK